MSKQAEKLKKQLVDLSEAVNAFNSESVQLKIIDRVLTHLTRQNKIDEDLEMPVTNEDQDLLIDPSTTLPVKDVSPKEGKKPGVTLILQQLLNSDFFDTARTLPAIAQYINNQFSSGEFYTNRCAAWTCQQRQAQQKCCRQ